MTYSVPPELRGAHVGRDKLVKYLLDPLHPKGGSKAKFLLRFGFSADQSEVLAAALAEQFFRAPIAYYFTDEVGAQRVVCDGPIKTPDGRDPFIRTVWVMEPDCYARLLTIVPKPRRVRLP